jgi:uncharacterized repeat protein (TIGR03803 family)
MKKYNVGLYFGVVVSLLAATVTLQAGVFTDLHAFASGDPGDGNSPNDTILINGQLFGSTSQGGSSGNGMIYTLGTNGTGFADIHDFGGSDGALPNELLAVNDMLFGTTAFGGDYGNGTIFKMNTNGSGFVVLRSFQTNGLDPAVCFSGLTLNGDTLYGVSAFGGDTNSGTVFKIDTNGMNFAVLHDFTNNPDGASPRCRLVLNGSTLYGTTGGGGTNGQGTIFKLNTDGLGFAVMYHFAGAPAANTPQTGLTLDNNTLYGVATAGGISNAGAVFRIDTGGTGYAIIHSFTNREGSTPAGVVLVTNSLVYGTTQNQGPGPGGTVFRLGPTGANFTVLKNFTNGLTGGGPKGQLVMSGKAVYGVAGVLGPNGGGTVFQLLLAPVISTQPQDQTVAPNTTASFSVDAADEFPVTYQWYFNTNTLLAGQTANTLTLAGVTNGNAGAYTMVVTDNAGSVTSSPAMLTVSSGGTIPNISGQPQSLTRTNGNSATFTVTATSSAGGPTYQWYFNTNTLLGGQTASTLTLSGVTSGNAGAYTVVVGNSIGSVTSSPAVLTVLTLPTINGQPQGLNRTNGDSATFTVAATSNAGGPAYQWYFNTNTLLTGQTGSTLTLSGVTNGNAGAYTVVVGNNIGSVTSSPAVLTVVFPLPTISGQPQNLNRTNGDSASFTVTASTVAGALTYQWYFNTNTLLAGQTGSTLMLSGVTNGNAGAYTVVVANGGGSVTSSPAVLTVVFPLPVITAQPQGLTVTNGDPASFSVTATTVIGTLTYQWYFNTNTLIAGQTGNTYTIPLTLTNNAGAYTVVVANGGGTVTSSPAVLTVSTNSKPIILDQTQDQTVTNGDSAIFTVTAIGRGLLGYQWYTNKVNNPATYIGFGLRTNTPLVTTANTNKQLYYICIVTNSLGSATSSPVFLTVLTTPVITSNPQPATVAAGTTANFTVIAAGATLGFQWYSNNVNTAIGAGLAGQTASTYAFTANTNSNGKYYSVVVTNAFGRATSSPALLTVSTLPFITIQPLPGLVTNGSSLTFTSGAAGPGPLGYQWLLNTNVTVLNATNTTLTVNESNQPGYYSMKVTNSFGSATSSPALLTIISLPYITLQPLGATITNGSPITFTSAASGLGTLGYQWLYQTNALIAGATGTSLTFATANQPGTYSMMVTNLYGAATSSPALLNVVGKPLMLSSAFDKASGSFSFSYVNLAGSVNRLMATTNLANPNAWQAIATNVMATNGIWQVTDPNTARTNAVRLYRFSSP